MCFDEKCGEEYTNYIDCLVETNDFQSLTNDFQSLYSNLFCFNN